MAAAYFLIAILGCADGSVDCTPVMTVPTRYESEAACSSAAPGALLEHNNFDFPSLVAECRREAPRAASAERDRDPPPAVPTRRG
jgi:hypothetical protein